MTSPLHQQLLFAEHAFRSGDLVAASAWLKQVLMADPLHARANELSGYVAANQGAYEAAIQFLQVAVANSNPSPEALYYLGRALQARSDHQAAIPIFKKALAIAGDFFEGLHDLGLSLARCDQHEEAVTNFGKALQLRPQSFEALSNRGLSLKELDQLDDALEHFHQAFAINPGSAEVLVNIGLVLKARGQFEEALGIYERALAIKADSGAGLANRVAVLMALGRFEDASSACDAALALVPDNAEIWCHRGVLYGDDKRHNESLHAYERAVAIDPGLADGWHRIGLWMYEARRFDQALGNFEKAFALKPTLPDCVGNLARTCLMVGAFHRMQALQQSAQLGIERGQQLCSPFVGLALFQSLEDQRRCAEIFSKKIPESADSPAFDTDEHMRPRGKIAIGYFSSDFSEHVVSFLMAGVIECHDRDRFEVIGFSLAQSDDPMRQRLREGFDEFIDLSDLDLPTAVETARRRRLDIAIDLNGYTQGAWPALFSHRVAPLQVNYLGFPGTMGAPFVDYIIGDAVLIPPSLRDKYSEKVISLPETFQANDASRSLPHRASRSEYGLPENSFVFCSFNTPYKIHPEYFRLWMDILLQTVDSVLWLAKSCDAQVATLRRLAKEHGVAPERLHFAEPLPYALHLRRYTVVDVVLDTAPFGGGTSSSDALWCGVPIITFPGETFSSRMSASLLSAAKIPEFVVSSLSEYRNLAIRLATTDKQQLLTVSEFLVRERRHLSLFDTERFTRHLELAFQRIDHERRRGRSPEHMIVKAI